MEKITKTCYPYQILFPIQNHLEISLTIEKNRYDLPITSLFDNAIRDNKKRRFLFVSKVLGKHIPILPTTLQIIGRLLASSWYEDVEALKMDNTSELAAYLPLFVSHALPGKGDTDSDEVNLNKLLTKISKLGLLEKKYGLKEKTLFIGFAETATGIAQAVFNCFSNAGYIHTTREQLNGILPEFVFSEEHSHATEHLLYTMNKNFLKDYERIVLVDDELTTGNTAKNLINNLEGNKFGILTILDWRNKSQQESLNSLEDKTIIVSSLIKGTLDDVVEYDVNTIDNQIKFFSAEKAKVHYQELYINGHIKCESLNTSNGRFGITSDDQLRINTTITEASTVLLNRRKPGNLLCLGTEEFIYVPCVLSSMLGKGVYFHSTTRSPIISYNNEGYCIKNKIRFISPYDEDRCNYVYNIPKGFYTQVFVFLEKTINEKSKLMFMGMFRELGIEEVLFVNWV